MDMDTTGQPTVAADSSSCSTSKCLLCLEPAQPQKPDDCQALALSFVDLATESESQKFWNLPKKVFTQGMIEGVYCNNCYNQLHEMNFLQKKIKTLRDFLLKLQTDVESAILDKYNKEGDSPGESDSKKVAQLRQQFYKLSLKIMNVENSEEFGSNHFDDCEYSDEPADGFVECNVYVEDNNEPYNKITVPMSKRLTRKKRKPRKLLSCSTDKKPKRKSTTLGERSNTRKPEQDKLKQKAIVKLERLEIMQTLGRKRKSPKFRNTSHLGRSLNSNTKTVRLGLPKVKKRVPKRSSDCDYCGERFPDRTQLRIHANEVHEDEKTLKCTTADCEATFFTKTELKKHLRKHEVQMASWRCHICQKRLPTELVLQAHVMSHTNEEKVPHYKCSICGKKYNNLQLLNAHRRYIHELRERFVCRVCGKTFGTESYLAAHEVSHDSIGHHLCELCGKSYKHKKDLRLHDLKVHSIGVNLKPHVCSVCDRGFYRADHLRLHQVKENHYEEGQQPVEIPTKDVNDADDTMLLEEFKCTICGKEFVSDIAMRTHLLTHAEKVDSPMCLHACPECDRRYQNSKSLDYHIKYMHKLKATHKCSHCEKTFGRLSSLKRHESVHDTTSSYHCTECEKVYKNKIDVENHYKREHLGVTTFQHYCTQCNKKFYRKDMLRLHQVKSGHYAPGSLDSTKSTSTQIIVVEASEVPPMSAKLEVIEEDEDYEFENEADAMHVPEVEEHGISEHDELVAEIEEQEYITEEIETQELEAQEIETQEIDTQEIETQEIETEEIETQEIVEGVVLDTDTELNLNMFIESMQ